MPTGHIGEIQLKRYVTLGYYKDEDKNREAFTADGYFRTGDLGFYDKDGFLNFRGRIKEMIKTGGLNVAPAEVEEILTRQPGVKLAFVVGLPDPRRDEVVAAVIVPDSEPPKADLRESLDKALKAELASFKVPKSYAFVAEKDLPMTASGKVFKRRLHELF